MMSDVLMKDVLIKCENRLSSLVCCKQDGSVCNCVESLQEDFFNRPDSYNCDKKMTTYVLRYGLAYASEIYHYFVASDLKGKIDVSRSLNIISLGCGFSPDYFALKKYIQNHAIDVPVRYRGLDNSICWNFARPDTAECCYQDANLTSPFSLQGADIVIMSKVFSTLFKNGLADEFLYQLNKAVIDTLRQGAILVFIDVNHKDMGRDYFHLNVKKYMRNFDQYYFSGYCEYNWIQIQQSHLVFNVPDQLSVASRQSTGSTVVFEYRK